MFFVFFVFFNPKRRLSETGPSLRLQTVAREQRAGLSWQMKATPPPHTLSQSRCRVFTSWGPTGWGWGRGGGGDNETQTSMAFLPRALLSSHRLLMRIHTQLVITEHSYTSYTNSCTQYLFFSEFAITCNMMGFMSVLLFKIFWWMMLKCAARKETLDYYSSCLCVVSENVKRNGANRWVFILRTSYTNVFTHLKWNY